MRKPRPRPPKAQPATLTLSDNQRADLAAEAIYVGSPHHTDIPKYELNAAPRTGASTIDQAEAAKTKNPDCLVCPRKWARRQADATALLQSALILGNFVSEGETNMPSPIWARDPDDPSVVYEAKLCTSPKGYKAYPLTSFQVAHNLPFELPL